MALIKCPECGKEISDKSKQCIHCGYPLEISIEKKSIATQEDVVYDVIYDGYSDENVRQAMHIQLIGHICRICNIGVGFAKEIVDTPPCAVMDGLDKENAEWLKNDLEKFQCDVHIEASSTTFKLENNVKINRLNKNSTKVICPCCGSSKITTGQRGFSIWTGFLGSNTTVNRCAKCGHSWRPYSY